MEDFRDDIKFLRNKFGKSDPVYLDCFIAFLVLGTLGIIFDFVPKNSVPGWDGYLAKVHGLLFAILIIVGLTAWFKQIQARNNLVKKFYGQLEGIWDLGEEEDVRLKEGIIKRLVESGESPLMLYFIQLPKVNLIKADLSEAYLNFANLMEADLQGANLVATDLSLVELDRANLNGADLSGANLMWAKNITCEQIQSAKIDRETKLPDYIKVTWTGDDTYSCSYVSNPDQKEKRPSELYYFVTEYNSKRLGEAGEKNFQLVGDESYRQAPQE